MSKKSRKNQKRKKEKQRKYRIFYLLILLLMTTISLSVTSYAWFTTNRIVRVDLLDVNVKAQGGIEISTDGTSWKSAIDVDDIKSARETYSTSINQIPKTLEPVSTIKSIENGMLKMFYGTVEGNTSGDYILSATRSIETESFDEGSNGIFITFDIFLKTNKASELYLTKESNITYRGETSYGIENAVRVAFIEEGNVPNGTNVATIQQLSTNRTENIYFWEPNYNSHTKTGIANAKNTYNLTTTENGNQLGYDGISKEISKSIEIMPSMANSTAYPEYFSKVNIDYYTEKDFTTNFQIFNIKTGITKYRIYMWIEGQDVDCENDASVGNVTFNLQFTTNPS